MKLQSLSGKGFDMVRKARGTLTEEKTTIKKEEKTKIEVVILGIDEGEGTVNEILQQVCKELKV